MIPMGNSPICDEIWNFVWILNFPSEQNFTIFYLSKIYSVFAWNRLRFGIPYEYIVDIF